MDVELERVRQVLDRAIRRICPRWLVDQREDMLQAAHLKLLKRDRNQGALAAEPSYLWRVAHSAVMDEIRRRRRRREVDHPLDEANHPDDSPAGDPSAGEVQAAIRDGLKKLAPSRRQAVLLFLHGMSIRDSATALGWTTKRVDNERYRGLAELRGHLERKGFRP